MKVWTLNIKRVLATLLATLALSVGLGLSQAAPADALCRTGYVYNGSNISFFYQTSDGVWRTLRGRQETSISYDVNWVQVPYGYSAKVYEGNNAPYTRGSGVTFAIRHCVKTTVILTR